MPDSLSLYPLFVVDFGKQVSGKISASWSQPPKGGWGCLLSLSCLESQGCHLIPLSYLLSCFFLPSPLALSVLSFFLLMVHSPDVFPENSQIFFVKG